MARRSRKKSPRRPSYFDSIAQAAARLKIPVAELRRRKREGAPGFRGSRVYPGELLPWLREREKEIAAAGQPETRDALELRQLRVKCERQEFDFALDKKHYEKKSTVAERLRSLAEEQRTILRQKLENEYPSIITSLDPAQARIYGKRLVDDICSRMQPLLDAWQ